MRYRQAVRECRIKKWGGLFLVVIASISTCISFLKMLYIGLDDGTSLGEVIARPFMQLIRLVYENTQNLSWFWVHSPDPDITKIFKIDNLCFIIVYLVIFAGLAIRASGIKLSKRIEAIHRKIEDQLIEESIKGTSARNREEIENNVNIPSSSMFSQVHQLYLAPIITAVVGGVLLKLVGY